MVELDLDQAMVNFSNQLVNKSLIVWGQYEECYKVGETKLSNFTDHIFFCCCCCVLRSVLIQISFICPQIRQKI